MAMQSKSLARRALSTAIAAVAMAMSARRAIAAAYAYTITDLGVPSGQTDTEGAAINTSGHVVINTDNVGPGTHAEYYNGSTYQSLGTLASAGDTFKSLNAGGLAVGFSYNSSGTSLAVYENTSSPINPTALAGGQGAACGVNTTGTIVGASGSTLKAVTWASTGASPLPITFPSGSWDNSATSIAQGINGTGVIVGQATATNGDTDAFMDVSGTITDISPTSGVASVAESINTGNMAVGNSVDADGNVLAFLHTSTGGTVLLPPLGGTIDSSDAESINNSGQVVGDADAPDDSGEHAVLYGSSTSITDLNSQFDPTISPGWVLTNAESINDAGSIVGFGTLNGIQEAFLLTPNPTPVPEPTSIGLLLATGTVLLRRRRA